MDKYIENVAIILGEHTPPPDGFQKINIDLNKGAGGEFIFLCYQRGNNPIKAIKGLSILIDSQQVSVGHEKIDIDLNKGAGGRFLFLSFTRIPVGSPPLTDLGVITWQDPKQPAVLPSPEWNRLDVDLNLGAKGWFIHIIYKLEQ